MVVHVLIMTLSTLKPLQAAGRADRNSRVKDVLAHWGVVVGAIGLQKKKNNKKKKGFAVLR